MPSVEESYWSLPSGPAWAWWVLAILPLDTQAQVGTHPRDLPQASSLFLCAQVKEKEKEINPHSCFFSFLQMSFPKKNLYPQQYSVL